MASYTLAETARILRISPARLRYWEKTALLRPRADEPVQVGFDFKDLVELRGVVGLIQGGVPLRQIRRSVSTLRERVPAIDQPLRALHLHRPSGCVVVRDGDTLVEPEGQLVLDLPSSDGEAALSELRPAADPSEESAVAWFERASSLDGDPATAAEAAAGYRRALELAPDFADAHCNLGTLHYNRGERDEAQACYENALAVDPDHLEANFNLANLQEEAGARERALHFYKAAVRADPFFPEARLNLALLYEKLGLHRTARVHWRRYLQLVPEGSWADLARERLSKPE